MKWVLLFLFLKKKIIKFFRWARVGLCFLGLALFVKIMDFIEKRSEDDK